MLTMPADVTITHDRPIRTWFNCGGRAARYAQPATIEQLRQCLAIDRDLRVLGDGANLLIGDEGVDELVVELNTGEFAAVQIDIDAARGSGLVRAGAGVNLPKLIHQTHAAGLCGLEVLGGIPASIGGAAVMNAGGAFGEIGTFVEAVEVMARDGQIHTLPKASCTFAYRHSTFGEMERPIITAVHLRLSTGDTAAARAKLLEVMAYKKRTQPMAADSAGCTFKNPTLASAIETIGVAGQRVSAGLLIDRAGCKGLRIGGAEVSSQHGNFFVTHAGCTATDLLNLMAEVRRRVHGQFGVMLRPEVAIWGREATRMFAEVGSMHHR
ncbi:MAG: UDP-N-acetylmuramate dehydrogenase [Phycisphaerales bacterium]|nr:UDP-N-acetylmuramate dehydrogenase [Phycisphaerales bacterium]